MATILAAKDNPCGAYLDLNAASTSTPAMTSWGEHRELLTGTWTAMTKPYRTERSHFTQVPTILTATRPLMELVPETARDLHDRAIEVVTEVIDELKLPGEGPPRRGAAGVISGSRSTRGCRYPGSCGMPDEIGRSHASASSALADTVGVRAARARSRARVHWTRTLAKAAGHCEWDCGVRPEREDGRP